MLYIIILIEIIHIPFVHETTYYILFFHYICILLIIINIILKKVQPVGWQVSDNVQVSDF